MSRKSPPDEEGQTTVNPPADTPKKPQDEEFLTMGRIQRLLAKLPDDGTRARVIEYLHSRYVGGKDKS